MSEPFLGEIKIISWNFPPKGWAFCNGQLLAINQNQALFALFGTTYGGDGRVTFALPNLQGRTPLHMGSGFTIGEVGGETSHTINISELPAHNHILNGTSVTGNLIIAAGNLPAQSPSRERAVGDRRAVVVVRVVRAADAGATAMTDVSDVVSKSIIF